MKTKDFLDVWNIYDERAFLKHLSTLLHPSEIHSFFDGAMHPCEKESLRPQSFSVPLATGRFVDQKFSATDRIEYTWILHECLTALGGDSNGKGSGHLHIYIASFYLACHSTLGPGHLDLVSLATSIIARACLDADMQTQVHVFGFACFLARTHRRKGHDLDNPKVYYELLISCVLSMISRTMSMRAITTIRGDVQGDDKMTMVSDLPISQLNMDIWSDVIRRVADDSEASSLRKMLP